MRHDVGGVGEADVAFETGGRHDGIPATGHVDAEDHDDEERERHDDGLHEVGHGRGQKSAENGVSGNDHGADEHAGDVVEAAERGEELAAGSEAGGGVGNEEDDDDERRNAHEQAARVVEAAGEEVGNGDGVYFFAVHAQSFGHDEPVEVGAYGKADGRPAGFGNAGEQGEAGQAHEQPGGHVGGFRAHGGDDGPHFAAAQIVFMGVAVAFGADEADVEHEKQINGNGDVYEDLIVAHGRYSGKRKCRHIAGEPGCRPGQGAEERALLLKGAGRRRKGPG